MSTKKKISNADFVAATKAVVKYKECVADDVGSFADIMGVFFVHGETLDIFKPFDMVANGAIIVNISDDVWSDYFNCWLDFVGLFKKDDGHDVLYTAFVMMSGMIARRSHEFSQAAFIGVYGSFRIALANCIQSCYARIRGGKSLTEKFEMIEHDISDTKSIARLVGIQGKDGKCRGDYLELQFEIFKDKYKAGVRVCLNGEKVSPKIRGKGGVLYDVWRVAEYKGVRIPKNAGMEEIDWEGKTTLYNNWINRLKREGCYNGRKNKPGAGGARQRLRK